MLRPFTLSTCLNKTQDYNSSDDILLLILILFLLRGCTTKKTKKMHAQKQFDLLIMLIIILLFYETHSKPGLRYEEVPAAKNSVNPYNHNESKSYKKDIDKKNVEESNPYTDDCKERYTKQEVITSIDAYEHIAVNDVVLPDDNSDIYEHIENPLPPISTCQEEISNNLPSSLSSTIKQDYVGATVTVLLSNLSKVTGEVVFNFNHILSLKVGSKLMFINDKNIISFY